MVELGNIAKDKARSSEVSTWDGDVTDRRTLSV